MRLFEQIKSPIVCLVFSPDGRTLAAACDKRMTVGLWELPAGKFRRWNPYADTTVRCLAYSADGTYLAVGDDGGMVLPYVVAEESYHSECHAGEPFGAREPVYAIAFAPHRPLLAAVSMGVTLWDLPAGAKCWGAQLAEDRDELFRAVAWSPDGKVLAASNEDPQAITLWKLNRALKPVESWNEWDLPAPSPSLAFSPDGRTRAAASDDEVVLFDATGKASRVGVLGGHGGFVWQVAYHPGGKMLATASEDGTVRFWDARSGKQRACYDWGIGKVCALAFAPDGMTCAAGGDTGRVVLWDVDD